MHGCDDPRCVSALAYVGRSQAKAATGRIGGLSSLEEASRRSSERLPDGPIRSALLAGEIAGYCAPLPGAL